jgi:divalent metal cation (Fe/Co/Zn/Cd) transporter
MMLAISLLFGAVCAVLAAIPLAFIFHNVYEDGLIGRAGLAGISFSAALLLLAWFDYDAFPIFPFYESLPLLVLEVMFFAVFLMWHLFRFHRRVLRRTA